MVREWWISTRASPTTDLMRELEPGMVGGGASTGQQLGAVMELSPRRGRWPVEADEGMERFLGLVGRGRHREVFPSIIKKLFFYK